ncbi:non-ribosomal peptide synthetase [Sinanaerobacter chloroacetimidivorans]|uniref:Amino acid adenylation domain-containing protein n=1 Tax=Sinanaerobacter chloroacetimidivorans TaxID=2818044 RepID=A0A8J7W4M6_9FIRM|nr:non-ribosomal peptide synthetase [Sinanaerobacter chloroacetimidivorans]MBR0599278.1 amino acid adenylation domain-containing protein [Sinanaerobacter chloroacetimidivorans]
MVEYLDLTQPQMRIWDTERFFQGTSISNIGGTLLLKEELDFKLWEQAINQFIESNDSIRLQIKVIGEKPVQYVSEYQKRTFGIIDFCGKTKEEQDFWLLNKMKTPFNLIDSDLFEFYLMKSWDGEQGYYVKFHHIIGDAWTISLLGTQTMENYKNLKEGNGNAADRKPSYLDYLKSEKDYLNSSKYRIDGEYWSEKFPQKPNPTSIKLKTKDYYSSNAGRKTYIVDGKEAAIIRQFCEEHALSPAVVFETALCIYAGKFLGFWEVSFGSLVLNRSGAKEKAMTGMFISTVPLTIRMDQQSTFLELCRQMGKEHMEVFRHQRYPYNILLSEIRKKHKISTNLFDFSVSYQNSKILKTNHDFQFKTTWYPNGSVAESLCLHIDDRDDTGAFILHFDYLEDLFTEEEIDDLQKRIMLFLRQGTKDETGKICDMELVDEIERNRILNEFNHTFFNFPGDITACQLFEEQAEKTPDAIAVRFEDQYLTYRELNQKANQLARVLSRKGVTPDTIAGIMVNRSLEMIIGVFGVLKAGGAYLPIDPEYPPERISYMLQDSGVNLLLIQSHLKDRIPFMTELGEPADGESGILAEGKNAEGKAGAIVEIDDPKIYIGDDSNTIHCAKPQNLVYVIYTSGSTGKPKGVMVTNENFVNASFAWRKEYDLDQFPVKLLQIASFSFDVFAGDLARALFNGGEMIICRNKDQYNPRNLYALVEKHRINILESTPALLIPFMDYVYDNQLDISCLKLLIIGSDICPIKNYKEIVERYGSQMRVINSYGVTEATIDTSYYEEPLDKIPSAGSTPIGKPMTNMKLLIVNEQCKLLPIGFSGELCIGGKGVTKGYINNPDLTAEKFIKNPYCKKEYLYRTGDLARYMNDGNVEFFGRIDNQVKIKGFRIELGEIETQLLNLKFIDDAVVVAKNSEEGNKYLCAYIVSPQDIKTVNLKSYLSESLPEYMVPAFYVQLEKIPLSPNGKVDRKQLPDPDRNNQKRAKYTAPRNNEEKILAKICSKILKVRKIGIDDNFFELGCDSLGIIQIQIVTYAFDWNLTMQDFYRYPTIRQLSDRIGEITNENLSAESNIIYSMPRIRKYKNAKKDIESGSVLLTGSTGFLGIHILKELLTAGNQDIYCLVRGKNKKDARDRLLNLLKDYFPQLDQTVIENRIFAVKGDVSQHNLGLSDKEYEKLGRKVDVVIHSAAIVKHYGNYPDFQKANVIGTQQVVRFANQFKLPLNHVSTVSVSGEYLVNEPKRRMRFTEKDFDIGQNYKDNLYVRSKFEAENIILKAMGEGLEATIFRMGNLTGRYCDGIFQKNIRENAFYNRLKSIIDMKAIPKYLLAQEIEFTPIDYASKMVSILSMKGESRGRAFHILNPKKIKIKELISMFNLLSLNIEELDSRKFENYIKEISSSESRQNILFGLINDLHDRKALNYKFAIEPDTKITRDHLKKFELEWPEISLDYIRKIVCHMKDTGFI